MLLHLDNLQRSRITQLLEQLIRDLHTITAGADGEDVSQKGTQLLEIYALEIQMHNKMRNFKKLKVSETILTCFRRAYLISFNFLIPGNIQRCQFSSFGYSSSADHRSHQRVRRENVDGRT